MGKVYVKKENTHNKIEIAFRELLSQKPFKDITINNIVEKAGINRSTFYTHFQDKESIRALSSSAFSCLASSTFSRITSARAFNRS